MDLSGILPAFLLDAEVPLVGRLGDVPLTATLGVGVATLGVTYWLVGRWRDRNLPPGPWGLPFIGASFRIGRELHIECLKMREKYGDIVSFYDNGILVVVLSGYKVLQEALTTEIFSDRPTMNKPFVNEYMDELFFCNLNNNKTFKRDRKFATSAIRKFTRGASSLEDKVQRVMDRVVAKLQKQDGKPVVFQQVIKQYLARCITSIVFNSDYSEDDPQLIRFIQACKDWYDCFLGRSPFLYKYLPSWLSKIIFKEYSQMWSRLRTLKEFVIEQVVEHQATFDPDKIRDITDAYLQATGPNVDLETLWNTIVLFCPDNVETAGVLIDWSFYYLTQFPHVQRKCQEELDRVVGRGRKPTMAHKQELPYLEATILECCRICPVFPLAAPHKLARDVTFHGYKIPSEKCYVFPSLYSVHMDETIFPEPHNFDPGHFLNSKGQLINSEHMVIFSMGRRICLGEQLSRVEIFLGFANLLHNFTFCLPDDRPTPSLGYRTYGGLTGMVICMPEKNVSMRAIPRQ